jgi:hypothetical protein
MHGACAADADPVSSSAGTSGFLADYSLLVPGPNSHLTQYYLAPGASAKLSDYKSIMVDHPEVFIDKDSPYQGFKPAQLAVVVETFRQAVIEALSDDYTITDQPGPGVLYLRLGLVNLKASKDRTKVLEFTPVGLVYKAGRQAVSSDYNNAVRHTSLVGLKIEGELRDSQSSELFGEFVDEYGGTTTPVSWPELATEMQYFSGLVDCQLQNARAAADDRVNCRASD